MSPRGMARAGHASFGNPALFFTFFSFVFMIFASNGLFSFFCEGLGGLGSWGFYD